MTALVGHFGYDVVVWLGALSFHSNYGKLLHVLIYNLQSAENKNSASNRSVFALYLLLLVPFPIKHPLGNNTNLGLGVKKFI